MRSSGVAGVIPYPSGLIPPQVSSWSLVLAGLPPVWLPVSGAFCAIFSLAFYSAFDCDPFARVRSIEPPFVDPLTASGAV